MFYVYFIFTLICGDFNNASSIGFNIWPDDEAWPDNCELNCVSEDCEIVCNIFLFALGSCWFVNDDFTGGETYFSNYNYEVKPEPGTVILFSSGKDHIHGVNEVLSGERYTMTTWYTKNKEFSLKWIENLDFMW